MNFSKLVSERYSCRKYLDKPVEREKIKLCVKAARKAPSACNAQPWKFLVLDESGERKRAADAATSGMYRYSRFLHKAPVLIAVLADKGNFMSKAGGLVRNTNFYLLDIGIACEHIALQAVEAGLGTCFVGWFSEKGVKKALGIPSKYRIPLLICMGYPQDNPKKRDITRRRAGSDNRKSLEEVLFFNKLKQPDRQ